MCREPGPWRLRQRARRRLAPRGWVPGSAPWTPGGENARRAAAGSKGAAMSGRHGPHDLRGHLGPHGLHGHPGPHGPHGADDTHGFHGPHGPHGADDTHGFHGPPDPDLHGSESPWD